MDDMFSLPNLPNVNYRTFSTIDEWSNKNNNHNDNLNVLHVNIRSLNKHWNELLVNLHDVLDNIDVLVITEINIHSDTVDQYNIDGYDRYQYLRPSPDSRHGGLVIFVKSGINKTQNMSFVTNNFDHVWVDITTKHQIISIIGVYRSPSNSKPVFIEQLDSLLQLVNKKQGVILIGDMNINMNNEQDRYVSQLLDVTASHGLLQLVQHYTREETTITQTTKTTIDLIFTTTHNVQYLASVIKQKISDHYFISLIYNTSLQHNSPQVKNKKYNENKLKKSLETNKWNELLNLNDPTTLYDKICKSFQESYENCTLTSTDNKTCKRKQHEWITTELKNMLQERDRLYRLHRNTPGNPIYLNNYKKYRNKTNKKIKQVKNQYYRSLFADVICYITKCLTCLSNDLQNILDPSFLWV